MIEDFYFKKYIDHEFDGKEYQIYLEANIIS